MKIDSINALTTYKKKRGKAVLTKSDHNLLICNFNIKFAVKKSKSKIDRQEIFKFRDPEGW